MALLFLCLIFGTGRTQKIEAADTETDQAAAAQDELLAELDFDAIQQEVEPAVQPAVFFCRYGAFSFAGWRSLPHLPCRKCRSLLCQNSIPCAEGADEGAVSPRSGRRGARQFFLSL